MKNVTITLPEDVLARARVEAARQSKSLSRFVAALVEERCGALADPLAALDEFWRGPGFPGASKDLPTREELYAEREEELVRGYESARLCSGSGRSGEAEHRAGLDDDNRRSETAGPESTKPE